MTVFEDLGMADPKMKFSRSLVLTLTSHMLKMTIKWLETVSEGLKWTFWPDLY